TGSASRRSLSPQSAYSSATDATVFERATRPGEVTVTVMTCYSFHDCEKEICHKRHKSSVLFIFQKAYSCPSLWKEMNMKRVLPTIVLMLLANSAFAQAVIAVAQLNGTVRDTSGSVVANASVSLRNLDTNRAYTSSSDASGYYIVPNLPPGPYELNVTYAGFEPYTQSGIQLSVGQTATLEMTLAVQGRREVVDVISQSPAIEPTRTEISNVIATRQIDSLPISGR